LSDEYSDRWGFAREDAVEAIVDVGSQFLALVVVFREEDRSIDPQVGVLRGRIEVRGKPLGPAGNEAMRRINGLEEPFVFTWKRKNFLPTSWKLIRIENAALPDELYGYEPGDIRRALHGE